MLITNDGRRKREFVLFFNMLCYVCMICKKREREREREREIYFTPAYGGYLKSNNSNIAPSTRVSVYLAACNKPIYGYFHLQSPPPRPLPRRAGYSFKGGIFFSFFFLFFFSLLGKLLLLTLKAVGEIMTLISFFSCSPSTPHPHPHQRKGRGVGDEK